MGLSCPMCMYLPPLLSSNYAEQIKASCLLLQALLLWVLVVAHHMDVSN